jgi:rRNA maturation endonuclease Nob1
MSLTIQCPHCGNPFTFVAPATTCPYCGGNDSTSINPSAEATPTSATFTVTDSTTSQTENEE